MFNKNNKTMKNYTFLTDNFNESGIKQYFAINPDRIETLPLYSTYNDYGQEIGHTDAGDYHCDNSYSDAIQDLKTAILERYNIDVNDLHIIDSNKDFIIEPGDGVEYGFNEEEVNQFIAEWRKENENLVEIEGFDYWDGNNNKTIITSCDFGEPTHIIESNEELTKELNEAIEFCEFVSEGFGVKVYSYKNWLVMESQWQGSWDTYTIVDKEDYEFLQETSSAFPSLQN